MSQYILFAYKSNYCIYLILDTCISLGMNRLYDKIDVKIRSLTSPFLSIIWKHVAKNFIASSSIHRQSLQI